MALPKDLGGSGEGHNPEQLFALGLFVLLRSGHPRACQEARPRRPGSAKVTCEVTLNTDDDSFSLAVELEVALPGADKAALQALVEEAHQICPYSKATRGNVPVTLSIA